SVKPSNWIVCGALLAALAVITGAFGAHGLQDRLDKQKLKPDQVAERLDTYETAVHYHMVHAMALVLVGLGGYHDRSKLLAVSGWSFLTGLVLFSGCLYVLVFDGPRWLGAVVPLGGAAFILGWLSMCFAAGKQAE
ncbi:MAG: DUF423 domain-containing protein, partial [Pirellulales bacterium]